MKMKFLNPVFLEDENLTIRRGTKWACMEGQVVPLEEPLSGTYLGRARITRTRVMRYADISNKDLTCRHHLLLNDVDNLFRVLQDIYQGFTREEIVTMVWFEKI